MTIAPVQGSMYFDQEDTLVTGNICPPPRYHGTPRFVIKGNKLQPREFPSNMPLGPHRRPTPLRYPPSLGLGRGVNLIPHQDQVTGHELLPPIEGRKQLDNLTQLDEDIMDENSLPPIYHFPKADMVRLPLNVVEPRPGVWQVIAQDWDRVQIRHNQYNSYEVERRTHARPVKRLPKMERRHSRVSFHDNQLQKVTQQGLPDLEPRNRHKFTRPTPGYGGYVPRYPVPNLGNANNISRTTYKLYPSYAYVKQEHAHKGPLSNSVTTTPPFNPFNKVDRMELNSDKLLRKRPVQQRATKLK